MKLSECVSAWLQVTGKRQNVVAEKAGMSPSKLSEIVTGKNEDPQWSTIEKIARGFDVSVHVLLEGPPRPENDKGAGHAREVGGGSNPVLTALLEKIDAVRPAEDTWRGDVLQAQAALTEAVASLTRALLRDSANAGESDEPPGDPGRRAAADR